MSDATQPKRIAVIAEDEPLGRLLLTDAAATAGLDTISVDNGVQALEKVLAENPAIVLLDVDMPGMDGYTVCRRVREQPRFAMLPIVMVTGHEDTSAINQAFSAGATDYISKPVNWALLPHRLAYILRNAAATRALADREAKVRTLVEAIPDALWVVAPDGATRWSPNTRASMDDGDVLRHERLENAVPADFLHEALSLIAQTALDGQSRKLHYRDNRPSAVHYSAELRFSRCEDGDVLVVRQDTTESSRSAEHIERLAYFDTLTGLPNRQRCLDSAAAVINIAAAAGTGVAVVYLDLNSFKRINDSFGHSVGDLVLQGVAKRLSEVVEAFPSGTPAAALSRLGGDEFVILLANQDARSLALWVADACRTAFKEPITVNQLEFFTTPSIGAAVYPDDGANIDTLLKHADTAMYQAKATGVADVIFYTEAMSARVRDWHELESRLRRAVREDLLELRFQPKFRLQDNSLAGVEALSRWYDEKHGEIPPSRFVDIAEESGLIIDLGMWLVRSVCMQLRAWLDQGIATPVAINISGKDLVYGDPAFFIEQQMARYSIPPSMLEVEITESVFVNDSNAGKSSVQRLRNLGCRIALDDFGTGYSSLAYLSRFPPHRIKIDRSFVTCVDTSPGDAAIVNSMMSLANSLNLTVTAEGIERSGQLEWLRACGCHEGQGYLLARPLSARELEAQFLHTAPVQANPGPDSERFSVAPNAMGSQLRKR